MGKVWINLCTLPIFFVLELNQAWVYVELYTTKQWKVVPYLCVCDVGAIWGLHRQVVEGALFSIQRLGNDDGAHGLLYVKHTVAVSTCSTEGRSDSDTHSVNLHTNLENTPEYDEYVNKHIHKPVLFMDQWFSVMCRKVVKYVNLFLHSGIELSDCDQIEWTALDWKPLLHTHSSLIFLGVCDGVVEGGMAANRADLHNAYTYLHTHIDTRQRHTLLHELTAARWSTSTSHASNNDNANPLCLCAPINFGTACLWWVWSHCLINPWSQCSISEDFSLPSLREGLLCVFCIQCVSVASNMHLYVLCLPSQSDFPSGHSYILAHLFDHSNCSKAVESLMG